MCEKYKEYAYYNLDRNNGNTNVKSLLKTLGQKIVDHETIQLFAYSLSRYYVCVLHYFYIY